MNLLKTKLQIFKILTKISVYDILTNNFKVDLSERLKFQYRLPVKQFFEEINYNYPIEKTVNNKWLRRVMLFIHVFNSSTCLFYLIWNEDDQLIRLYLGDLIQFFGLNTKFFAIPLAGASLYALAMFCLFHFSPVSQLNWLKVFNPIEGKQSFISWKIFFKKSAKTLIRLTLIVIIFCVCLIYFAPIFVLINLLYFSFNNLIWNEFIFYAIPWAVINTFWIHLDCCYFFISLIILIICYYYESRLNQLNVYINFYLKRKQFNRINRQVNRLLNEYTQVINEMNQFNKFASKLIFFMLLFCSSTLVFLIYNMIYVKIDLLLYLLYILFGGNLALGIVLILMSSIKIASKFQRNKRNLIKLNYTKNMQIKYRIKVSCFVKVKT